MHVLPLVELVFILDFDHVLVLFVEEGNVREKLKSLSIVILAAVVVRK